MAKTIAILNFKGGVGKTTTTVNLADALRGYGKKCLVVDLDGQYNATTILDTNKEVVPQDSIYELLTASKITSLPLYEHTPGLDFLASDERMKNVEELLVGRMNKERILTKILKPILSAYDYIFLDCPPNSGVMTTNAMLAADSVLIPVSAEPLSLDGLKQVTKKIADVKEDEYLNPKLDIEGFLVTKYDSRTRGCKLVRDTLRKNFANKVFNAFIRSNTSVAVAPGCRQSVMEYDIESNGASDYLQLAREIAGISPSVKWKH